MPFYNQTFPPLKCQTRAFLPFFPESGLRSLSTENNDISPNRGNTITEAKKQPIIDICTLIVNKKKNYFYPKPI